MIRKAKKVKKPAMETPQRILQRPGSGEDADSAEFEIPTAVLDKKAANKEVKPAKKSRGEAGTGAKGLTPDSLRAALVRVVQSDAFVNMLYEELTR